MFRPVLMAASVLALAACSGERPADADIAKDSTPAAQKTVFDEQLKALEKAKAVEQQLQEDKEKRDKAMEEQGG